MPPGDVCSDIDLIREDDPLQHANPVPHYRILEHALVGFQIELATQIIGLCRDANDRKGAAIINPTLSEHNWVKMASAEDGFVQDRIGSC